MMNLFEAIQNERPWNQQGEHYFVCSHEEIFEVSKVVWMVSRVWENLFWVFIPLTPIGAFLIANIQEKIGQRKKY